MTRQETLKIILKVIQAIIVIGVFYFGMLTFSYFDRYRFYANKLASCNLKFIKESYQWNVCIQESSPLVSEFYGSFIKGCIAVIALTLIFIVSFKIVNSNLFQTEVN